MANKKDTKTQPKAAAPAAPAAKATPTTNNTQASGREKTSTGQQANKKK
jgi:hypothetical protein